MMKDRVRERLSALGISEYDAAIAAGRHRNYLWDFLSGRKARLSEEGEKLIADVLQTTVAYLYGHTDDPHRDGSSPPSEALHGTEDMGVAEAGAWRPAPATVPGIGRPVPKDHALPLGRQRPYVVRGDGTAGAPDGAIAVVCDLDALREAGADLAPGMLVLADRQAEGAPGLTETSLWQVESTAGALTLARVVRGAVVERVKIIEGGPVSVTAFVTLVMTYVWRHQPIEGWCQT